MFALLEFLRTTRENLKLRFIAVEHNGLGQTAFDNTLGFSDYAGDVEELLAYLGVDRFSLFAISGGGPYSARVASRNPDRLISVHLAAALTYSDPTSNLCFAPTSPPDVPLAHRVVRHVTAASRRPPDASCREVSHQEARPESLI